MPEVKTPESALPEQRPQDTASCGMGGCGIKMKPKRLLIGAVLGAAAGFAYWYFVGCAGGNCPITSSPYISTLYGAGMGALLLGL